MKKSKITKITQIILKLILIIGTICLFIIPRLYNLLSDSGIPTFQSHTTYYKIAFYLCYIISLSVIYILHYIFNNIYKDTPFKKEIELSLKLIAILFMSLSIIIIIKTIYIPTILSLAVIIVTSVASLCFYTLSQIFKVAINYKKEIDYTM